MCQIPGYGEESSESSELAAMEDSRQYDAVAFMGLFVVCLFKKRRREGVRERKREWSYKTFLRAA